MNSLSYLSRQFDVLASAGTPPSTPTTETSRALGDPPWRREPLPQLKRTRTWSARSFFIPSPAQASEHLQRRQLQQDPQDRQTAQDAPARARRRAGSTPSSARWPLAPAVLAPSASAASRQPDTDAGGRGSDVQASSASAKQPSAWTHQPSAPSSASSTTSLSGSLATMTASKSKPLHSDLRGLRRTHVFRALLLLGQWLYAAWDGLARALWLPGGFGAGGAEDKGAGADDAETSADEKESDDDTLVEGGSDAGDAARSDDDEGPVTRARTSPRRRAALQAKLRPPSPLSQGAVLLPAVRLVPPPDSPPKEPASPASPASPSFPSLELESISSSSSLSPPAHYAGPSPALAGGTPVSPRTPFHLPKTLVLDLDETLIHSTTRPLFASGGGGGLLGLGGVVGFGRKGRAGHMVEVVMGERSTLYHVYKRPFVDYFLRKVSGWYTLVIFTASMREYADPVIDWLDAGHGILARRLFRESCTQLPNGSYTKDLSLVEQDLSRVFLIDNSPVSYTINQANGIPIEGWTHDLSDEALLDLLPVLDSLRFTSDVRRVLGLRGF